MLYHFIAISIKSKTNENNIMSTLKVRKITKPSKKKDMYNKTNLYCHKLEKNSKTDKSKS